MRAVRILAALLFPMSGHFAAGRYRRAAAWVAAFLVADFAALWIGMIPVLAVWLASAIDVAIIRPAPNRGAGAQLLAALVTACVAVLVQLTIRGAWAQPFKIPAASMIPALQVGDHILAELRARTPARGDIIVFRYPKEPRLDFIKRAVAVGGDTIEIKGRQLVLNGKPVPMRKLDEPCAYQDYIEEAARWEERKCEAWEETLDGRSYRVVFDEHTQPRDFPPVTVPAGHAYVLGDNRDNSHDSRYWGTVPPENVRGTARIVWYARDWHRINQRVK